MPRLLPFAAVKPEAWPPDLRRLHGLRQAKVSPLAQPSAASRWRKSTFQLRLWDVGYFLGRLKWSNRVDEEAEFKDYVTPDVMGDYVENMRDAGLSPRTIATRVDGVRAVLAALSPDVPTTWLMHGVNELRAELSDRRRTQ